MPELASNVSAEQATPVLGKHVGTLPPISLQAAPYAPSPSSQSQLHSTPTTGRSIIKLAGHRDHSDTTALLDQSNWLPLRAHRRVTAVIASKEQSELTLPYWVRVATITPGFSCPDGCFWPMIKLPKTYRLPILVICVLTSATVVGLFQSVHQPRARLAAQLRRRAETASASEVAVHIRELAALGSVGIGPLVNGLGSQKEAVARAAEETLKNAFEQWKYLPNSESTLLLETTARELAAQVEQFGIAGQRSATELAARILRWPVDRDKCDVENLLRDCSEVLRAGSLAPPETGGASINIARLQSDRESRGTRRPSRLGTRPDAAAVTANLNPELTEMAGGGIPFSPARLPTLPPSFRAQRQRPPSRDSTELPPNMPSRTPDTMQIVPRGEMPSLESPDLDRFNRLLPLSSNTKPPATPLPPNKQLGTVRLAAALDLRPLKDIELLRLYVEVERSEGDVEQYATELQARGYQHLELRMATHLFAADPKSRREFVSSLPRLRGVDAKKWLSWLADDSDASVRIEAIHTLATSADPSVKRMLHAKRISDPDRTVRQAIEQVLQNRR